MNCLRHTFREIGRINKYGIVRRISQTSSARNLVQPQVDQNKTYSPKLEQIVTDITKLNLLEVAELTDLLKKRLNLPDTPIGFAAVSPAAGGVASSAASASPDPAEEEKPVEVTYTVKLVKYDEKQKIALIKEMKNIMEGMNLVQAKKFVESIPAVVKADISKADAEKLKEALVKVGGEIEITS